MIDSTEHVQEAPVPEVLNHENVVPEPTIPPAIEAMTIEPRPPVQPMQPVQQVEQPLVQMPPEQQMYFQQQQQQQPQQPQTRPLTEVLGPGSFSFLQVLFCSQHITFSTIKRINCF